MERTGDFLTVTLLDAVAATAPDGAAAVALHLKEQGTIVFEVSLPSIARLRQALMDAEGFLRQGVGHS